MRQMMFAIGSLATAIGAVLLVIAAISGPLFGRPLTGIESLLAALISAIVGFVWWRSLRRKLQDRGAELTK